jgi:hypothetical protein
MGITQEYPERLNSVSKFNNYIYQGFKSRYKIELDKGL